MSALQQDDLKRPFRTPYSSFGSMTSDAAVMPTPPSQALAHDDPGEDVESSPGYSMAQFSFGPATQTTVVTTTTTTMTSFPPLIMKDPRRLTSLDPKQYPLASSPTPAAIKNFTFNHNGQNALFEEADDARSATARLQQQQREMEENGGVIRHVKRRKLDSLADWSKTGSLSRQASFSQHAPLSPSPQLALEAARIQTPPATQRPAFKPQENRQSRLQMVQTSTPITPSLDQTDDENSPPRQASSQQPPSPSRPPNSRSGLRVEIPGANETDSTGQEATRKSSLSQRGHDNARQGLSEGPEAQDASLPSPSLSPITAAANIAATRRGYFDHSDTLVNRSPPNETADEQDSFGTQANRMWDEPSRPQQQHGGPTMMDIPTMLNSFESMPQNVKSYVMFQLLRRSEKNVLQFVAENVNPALKCDYLALLPPELAQHVLGFLDVKSLCRAAQVSKKWRQVIDSSEKTWKDLMHRDGFTLGPLELRRAIAEGWGWQYGSHIKSEDWEKNLADTGSPEPEISLVQHYSEDHATAEEEEEYALKASQYAMDPSLQDMYAQTSPARRPMKRKSVIKLRPTPRKLQKRYEDKSDEPAAFDTTALVKQLTSNEGPFAAAQIAALTLPNPTNPEVGLPSLRSLHLYKSLYRRQHLIDSYWMSESRKPRHLAFKAHERHVVTCLHFDSERILTGSDDTNINVYDTKTGHQRTVLQGHDGGVWALKCYGNTLVSGSTDRSVRVWDIEAGHCTHVFHGHTSTVRCLVILTPTVIGKTPDGRPLVMPREPLIITGSRDSTLRVWKLPQPKDYAITKTMSPEETESHYFVRALTGHGHSVRAIAAHGDTLVSGSYDTTVRVWRVSTGESTFTLRGHTQKVYSVVLDTARNRCISGSMDNTVRIWSLTDGSCIHNLEGHNSLVGLLDLKGDRLVSAAADSTLRIWDPESGNCKATLMAHTGAITCFQHDAHKVISGSDRTLKMWDAKTGEFVRDLLTDLSGVWQVGFDGRRCVAAVQRDQLTYIEVLDFGAARDGHPSERRGVRIEVDNVGEDIASSPMSSASNEVLMALGDLQAGMI